MRSSTLALLALLTALLPLAGAQDASSLGIDWVALNVRDESGARVDPEVPVPAEGLKVEAAFENLGTEARSVQLRAEVVSADAVVWDGKTAFLDVPPGEATPLILPIDASLAPGEYTVRAFVMTDSGETTEAREHTFTVAGVAPAGVTVESGGSGGLVGVVLGFLTLTAAGAGVGFYDRGLHKKGKDILPDGAIAALAFAGGLVGLLIAFKATKHPERNVEPAVWVVLGAQGLLLAVLLWLFV